MVLADRGEFLIISGLVFRDAGLWSSAVMMRSPNIQQTPRKIALEIFDTWAEESGHYYDPVIVPSKDWNENAREWRHLVDLITDAINVERQMK